MKAVRVASLLLLVCCARAAAQTGYVVQTIGNPAHHNNAFGTAIAFIGDVDGDSRDDYVVFDPQTASLSGGPPGEVRLVSGSAGATLWSHYGDVGAGIIGPVLAAAGDVNFDGIPDYAVAYPSASFVVPGIPTGRVDVLSGLNGSPLFFTLNGGTYATAAQTYGDQLGSAVCAPGDITGDGIPDLVFGAQGASSVGGIEHGKVLIRSGATGAIITVNGTVPSSFFGAAACGPGDLNADGIADLVVGAPGGAGFVRAFAGGTGAILWTANGTINGAGFGSVVSAAGDVDGDGVNDLAVGAPITTTIGGTLTSGQAFVLSGATGAQLWSISGTVPDETLGWRVARAGDLNGDGYADVLVSSPNGGGAPYQGKVQLVLGPAGAVTQVIATGTAYDRLGTGLAGGRFLDGDGLPDILIGTPYSGSGRVTALSGATLAALYQLPGTAPTFAASHFTCAVDAGDQDGDGNPDLALGMVSQSASIALVSGTTSQLIRLLPGPLPGTPSTAPAVPVARVGDVDGDGYQDFAVAAATGPDSAGVDSARMDVVSGLTGSQLHSTTWSSCGLGEVRMVAPADYDGDGIRDVVIGLSIGGPASCPTFPPPGAGGWIEVRSGATGALLGQVNGLNPADGFAWSVDSPGDLDGDGIADILVGAPLAPVGFATGAVYAFSGAGLVPLFTAYGTAAGQWLGAAVTGIGDINGDGVLDFAAADLPPFHAASVPVSLFSGAGGTPLGTIAPVSVFGFGKTIAGVGDVDGDGAPDMAVGAPYADGVPAGMLLAAGEVFVFSGAGGGLLFSVRGKFANENYGNAISRIGDRNQDGLADVFAAAGGLTALADILSFAGVPTGSQAFGSPCALASGRTPALAAFGGDPTSATGNPAFGIIVSNGRSGALGAIAMGSSTTSWGGTALPLSLAPSLPGCSLSVSVDNLISFVLGAGSGGVGAIKFPIAVPLSPAIAGATAHFQAYVADSRAAALPGAVTRALTIVVQ